VPAEPDLSAELAAAEDIVMGDDSACRHCGGLIVPCAEPARFCKGWKHALFLHYGPVGAHYCEGRSINPMAEPEDWPDRGAAENGP
jgi:hypothetical protein